MTERTSMLVIINGTPRELPAHTTVAELLRELGLQLRGLAVEVNGELVPRHVLSERELQAQDKVEIVTLAGGG